MGKRGLVLLSVATMFALGFWAGNRLMTVRGPDETRRGFRGRSRREGWRGYHRPVRARRRLAEAFVAVARP